jgi:hypothetical protein
MFVLTDRKVCSAVIADELVSKEAIVDVPLIVELSLWGHTGLSPVRRGGVMPLGRG